MAPMAANASHSRACLRRLYHVEHEQTSANRGPCAARGASVRNKDGRARRSSSGKLTALTLWIGHSFKYHRFSVTPRLAALSPVRGCGKTTVLNLIKALAFKAKKFDNTRGQSLEPSAGR